MQDFLLVFASFLFSLSSAASRRDRSAKTNSASTRIDISPWLMRWTPPSPSWLAIKRDERDPSSPEDGSVDLLPRPLTSLVGCVYLLISYFFFSITKCLQHIFFAVGERLQSQWQTYSLFSFFSCTHLAREIWSYITIFVYNTKCAQFVPM